MSVNRNRGCNSFLQKKREVVAYRDLSVWDKRAEERLHSRGWLVRPCISETRMSPQREDEHESPWGRRKYAFVTGVALAAIVAHLVLRWTPGLSPFSAWPLWMALALGGVPVVSDLALKAVRLEFGSDLLAAVSIVTAVLLGEYLAGTLVVLMVGSGETIERFAVRRASSVLAALARRMPTIAHRREDEKVRDVAVDEVAVGEVLVIFPHEVCPVDGVVLQGHGSMDESFLTGEPYQMSKTPGADVISGALNGEAALTIRAVRRAVDSRYAQIMQVMRASEQHRPRLRRLGDQLGAFYTPLAIAVAIAAWLTTGNPTRFLAVLVTATPCPLLIAIPVAIIGAISLAARRSIIIKRPVVLEQIDQCTTLIFDKTGTLTYGKPHVTQVLSAEGLQASDVLRLAASVERYSKHPLAGAILQRAEEQSLTLAEASQISEMPGVGLTGTVEGRQVKITSRGKLAVEDAAQAALLPPPAGGLECIVLIDNRYAGTFRFRDKPRKEGRSFIDHLGPKHRVARVMIVSGDRESEVRYLAEQVGIEEVYASQTPEQKVAIARRETARAKTMFVGDGINDAPALAAATVGLAFGAGSDITSEAADAVIMDSSLARVDELLHISRRMRRIALQSAVGGMLASLAGMIVAAFGYLPPVGGAVLQEIIDVVAVLNATRAALPPRALTDYRR